MYKPELKDWPAYAERLQCYFTANDITDRDKKRATVLAPATHALIHSLPQNFCSNTVV